MSDLDLEAPIVASEKYPLYMTDDGKWVLKVDSDYNIIYPKDCQTDSQKVKVLESAVLLTAKQFAPPKR